MNLKAGEIELKFDEQKLKDVLKHLYAANRGLKLGMLECATNAEAGKNDASIAEYAYWNEYGTKSKKGNIHIPERPFMRNTLKEHRGEWIEIIRATMKGHITEQGIVERALGRVGAKGAKDIQQTISKGGFTENAPYTLKRKGDHKPPLIDTADMFNAISYEVTNSMGTDMLKHGTGKKWKGK